MMDSEDEFVRKMAQKHSVSSAAVQAVMIALRHGGGRMAQFSHPDFGGMSQWSPGMSMVGDMFNLQLKSKLDALCTDLATHLNTIEAADGAGRAAPEPVSYRSLGGLKEWWPTGLGRPGAVGAQNEVRYAVFPEARRLAIDDHGAIAIYDIGDRTILAVAQAQSSDQTLSFISQNGLVKITDLDRVGE
jgi:hypothetical protein